MSGWVKLRRSLKDWEWYDDINASRLLIHLLVSVNHENKKWKGIEIKSGSMVYSWDTLSKESGLSKQQCRTAMRKLINSKEVTIKSTNKYSLVSLLKWDKIQNDNKQYNNQTNKQTTNKQQTNNKQITTTKECKEYKEIKEEKKDVFFSWLKYRKEIKKEIKVKSTLKSLIDRFNSEPLEKCIWVVKNSIENNYQGLFWENFNRKTKSTTNREREKISL